LRNCFGDEAEAWCRDAHVDRYWGRGWRIPIQRIGTGTLLFMCALREHVQYLFCRGHPRGGHKALRWGVLNPG